MISRRQFFARASGTSAALLVASRLGAQQGSRGMHDSSVVRPRDTSNLFAMDQSVAPVRLPPKPNATPVLDDKQRDDLEHRIHCQCGCTLDVYTCRTTDFSCQVSPAMHRDVVELIKGGYSAQEIIDAFVGVHGDRALMAPRKSGFDLVAWLAPGAAVIVGGVVLATLLRTWGRRARANANTPASNFVATRDGTDATAEELARLEAAVRGDDQA